MSTVVRPRRSVLFMPGSNARALEKAKTLAADALIFDLEDAVAPEAKAVARQQVHNTVCAGGYGERELIRAGECLDHAVGTRRPHSGCRLWAGCGAGAESRERR